jgi:uncharacterized protein (TIRG00374 family)
MALRAVVAVASIVALILIIHLGWAQMKVAAALHRHWDLRWLVAAMLAQLLVYTCIAAMFKLNLGSRSKTLPVMFLLYVAFAFLFANRALPGPALMGVATLVYLLGKRGVTSTNSSAAAAAFYFSDYAGFFVLIVAVSAPLFLDQPNHSIRIVYLISVLIVIAFGAFAVWAIVRPMKAVDLLAKSARSLVRAPKFQQYLTRLLDTARRYILTFRDNIMLSMRPPMKILAFVALSIGMHAAEIATIVFGASAAGLTITVPVAAASYVAGNLASIISALPGAVGFYEAGMIGTMHGVGHIPYGDAAVCTLTYRLLSFWAPMPIVLHVLTKIAKDGISGRRHGLLNSRSQEEIGR